MYLGLTLSVNSAERAFPAKADFSPFNMYEPSHDVHDQPGENAPAHPAPAPGRGGGSIELDDHVAARERGADVTKR